MVFNFALDRIEFTRIIKSGERKTTGKYPENWTKIDSFFLKFECPDD